MKYEKLRVMAMLAPVIVLMMVVSPRQTDPQSKASHQAAASTTKVGKLYDNWQQRHRDAGGVMTLGLGPIDKVTLPTNGVGVARLDVSAGQVSVAADTLGEGDWHAWLLYNEPESGALPDAADRFVDLGSLVDGRLSQPLSDPLVDAVIISDGHPLDGFSLIGMTTTFQRLYIAREKAPGASDVLSFVRSAHAGVVDPDELLDPLVSLGRQIFEDEDFDGNGRACSTCHPAENNFTIDPAFIGSLAPDDPLFVAETNPALADLEDPVLMRERGLILVNADGFDRPGVFRSVPHLLALSTSIDAPRCDDEDGCPVGPPGQPPQVVYPYGAQMPIMDITTPDGTGYPPVDQFTARPVERTGWSGDGAPGSGSLHEFAIGAVVQHMPQTLNRQPGVDFRVPTMQELDALEIFQLSLGRTEDIELDDITLHDADAAEGKALFNRVDTQGGTVQAGKCALCHSDASANVGEEFGERAANNGFPEKTVGNNVFSTGVSARSPEGVPFDGGMGVLPLTEGECQTGHFDISGPLPVFVPDPPGTAEPGGFGGHTVPPFFVSGLCFDQFNAQPLIEAAETGPFFHNNSAETIEDAIRFYSSPDFNEKPAVQLVMRSFDSAKIGIDLTPESVARLGKFLRVLNADENLIQAIDMSLGSITAAGGDSDDLLNMAILQLHDAKRVLEEVGLHPLARLLIHTSVALGTIAEALSPGDSVREGLVSTMTQLGAVAQELMLSKN